jgi:hypothetical protein
MIFFMLNYYVMIRGVKFPVALSPISRRGRKTKNNGRVVSYIAWNYFGILHERKIIF